MRRVAIALVLALSLVGCGAAGLKGDPHGGQVPLVTVDLGYVEDPGEKSCYLLYWVVDVAADPDVGTVNQATGAPLRWPSGYTARRVGTEVEVRDTSGAVVLTTGRRYWLCPALYQPDWVIGNVMSCTVGDGLPPAPKCELGGGVL